MLVFPTAESPNSTILQTVLEEQQKKKKRRKKKPKKKKKTQKSHLGINIQGSC
jgi:hypothetical protein